MNEFCRMLYVMTLLQVILIQLIEPFYIYNFFKHTQYIKNMIWFMFYKNYLNEWLIIIVLTSD